LASVPIEFSDQGSNSLERGLIGFAFPPIEAGAPKDDTMAPLIQCLEPQPAHSMRPSAMSEPIPFPINRKRGIGSSGPGGDAFEFRVQTAPADIAESVRLRYRAYVDHGYLTPCSSGEYRDAYDTLPTTAMLGAYDDHRLVATMRICFCMPQHPLSTLPCAPYYPALASLAGGSNRRLMEVSRLAIEPSIGNTSYRTTLYGFMVRSAFAAARAAEVSTILVATRPERVAYYKHLLGFKQVGVPAHYPPGDLLITLLAGSLEEADRRVSTRNRFFRITETELARMRQAL
jgi:N-acyl-L-homoserine lactone synthetase